jgi:Sigma-70 region 2
MQAGRQFVEDADADASQLGRILAGCSVPKVATRLSTVRDERDIMPVAVTRDSSAEGSSLSDLYVHHAPEGIRLAFLLTGDRALAEDLVQDAFARLVGRLQHLRDKAAECTARMERALLGEFDASELYFIWTFGGVDLPIVREAIQRARASAK